LVITNPDNPTGHTISPEQQAALDWLNAFGFVTLAVTGLHIRFPEYVNIFGDYKTAIRLHNTAGFVVSTSYVLWFSYYLFVAKTLAKLYIPTLDEIRHGIFRRRWMAISWTTACVAS
jgi:Ni,Fe-hydrogenase I cytochrome b subunit